MMCDIELNNYEDFIENFGLNSKLIRRNQVPIFINEALKLNNSFIIDKIREDFMFYLYKCKKQNLPELIKILFEYSNDYKDIIINNFHEWSCLIVPLNVVDILKILISDNKSFDLIMNNMVIFLENACFEDEKKVIDLLNKIDECRKKIDFIIKLRENDKEYYKKMNLGTYYNLYVNGLVTEIDYYFDYYSNGNNKSIKYLSTGHTNVVYVIDSKYIVKIGKKRNIFDTTFFSYMISPYVRKEYIINEKVVATIEIQDFCDTSNINNEDYKCLLKQLEKENLVWLDENICNVGYLTKPNKRKINKDEDGFDYNEVFITEPQGNVGDLVIIDSDMLLSSKRTKLRHSKYNMLTNNYEYTILIDAKNSNVDESIKRLLNQLFKDFKVIIINYDNSIIDIYNKVDNRITCDNITFGEIINYNDDFIDPYYLYNKKCNKKMELK